MLNALSLSGLNRIKTLNPLFSGTTPDEKQKPNLTIVPNLSLPEDIDELVRFLKARDLQESFHKDSLGRWVTPCKLTGHIKTKNANIIKLDWLTERGTPVDSCQKFVLKRLLQKFVQTVHHNLRTLPNRCYEVVTFPIEYTFKAGEKAAHTLHWHKDHPEKYIGVLGLFKDNRIHGAQLEVQDDCTSQIESVETIPNQLAIFDNAKTTHRVSEATIDNSDSNTPALRQVLSLAINDW